MLCIMVCTMHNMHNDSMHYNDLMYIKTICYGFHLIYIDKYSLIESNMSDSQVGGRTGRNVRNHIWMVNGIICDVLSTIKKTAVDIQIFDYKQCFNFVYKSTNISSIFKAAFQCLLFLKI